MGTKALWYTINDDTVVGIVSVFDENNQEEKMYIWVWDWLNEEEDIKKILKFWAKFDWLALSLIFKK